MSEVVPGIAVRLMTKQMLTTRSLYVDKEWAVWCDRGPESNRGGYWWPLSASGCLLYGLWAKYGDRALCHQLT